MKLKIGCRIETSQGEPEKFGSMNSRMRDIYDEFSAIVKNDTESLSSKTNQVFCRYMAKYTKNVIVEIEISATPNVVLHGSYADLVPTIMVFLSTKSFIACDETAMTIHPDIALSELLFLWNYTFPMHPMVREKDTPILNFPITLNLPASVPSLGTVRVIEQEVFGTTIISITDILKSMFIADKCELHWEIFDAPMTFNMELRVLGTTLHIYFNNGADNAMS
jgi:hypothetical protein